MSISSRLPVRPTIRQSPRDIIRRGQIVWDYTKEAITISGIKGYVSIAEIADTNSMEGIFDYGHNVLLVSEFDKSKLEVGDIIVYTAPQGKVIHRIVEKGIDDMGRWFKVKGDTNFRDDPYILREINIIYLCIGIIY